MYDVTFIVSNWERATQDNDIGLDADDGHEEEQDYCFDDCDLCRQQHPCPFEPPPGYVREED